jgi:hypothetical protein
MLEKPPDKYQLHGDEFALFIVIVIVIVIVMSVVLIEQNNTNIHSI